MSVADATRADAADEPEETRGKGLDADGNRRPYLTIRREQHDLVKEELRERFGDNQRIDPSEDPIRWRRAIRTHSLVGPLYRVVIAVLGLALILVGIPMVPLVGPGWAIIFVGLFLWSTEFMWARKVTQFVKAEVKTFDQWARHLPWKLKIPLVLASIAFGWLCAYVALTFTGVPGWTPDRIEDYLLMVPGLERT